MNTSIRKPEGSGHTVADYAPFCEGDIEPTLNKPIHTLIDSDTDYIVYLDDELWVEWSFTPAYESPDGFADTANETALLETLAINSLTHGQRLHFARLLAEAMARVIGDRDTSKARESLASAASYLKARGTENARSWHVCAAGVASAVAAVAFFILFILRARASASFGDNAVTILLAALCGPLGALLSIVMRFKHLKVDATAGPFIHILEGVARVTTGALGALLIALGIRADLLLSFISSLPRSFAALLAVCIVSGASEYIVPSFIAHIEQHASATALKDDAT